MVQKRILKKLLSRKTLFFGFKIFLALFLLSYLLKTQQLDLKRVQRGFQNFPWILLSLILLGGNIGVSIFRWQLLLRTQGIKMGYWKALKLSFIGFFFNTFMPGSVGGDVVKAYYIAKKQNRKRFASVSSIFVDRMIGLFSLLLLACITIFLHFSFFSQQKELTYLLYFVTASVALGFLLLFLFLFCPLPSLSSTVPSSLFSKLLHRLRESLELYQKKKLYLFLGILLSLFAQSLTILSFFFLGLALGEKVDLVFYFTLVPLGLVIQAIPISFGGWGVGELAFQKLFLLTRPTKNLSFGADLCFLFHLTLTFWNLLGIVFYLEEKAEFDRLIQVEEAIS